MPVEEGEEVVLYGNGFWQARLGPELEKATPIQKLHLIYSLMVFLGVTLTSFLEFYFTSTIKDVRRRAGSFMAFRATASEGNQFAPGNLYRIWHDGWPNARDHLHKAVSSCAIEIALEESDRIISDKELQVETSKLTIAKMRELLSPSALMEKYQTHAPFTWELLMTFCGSPNEYRRRKAAAATHTAGSTEDVLMESDTSQSDDESGADSTENAKSGVPPLPQGFSRNPVLVVIIVIAMLTFTRNRATNVLPLLLGLFFKISGTSTRAIQMLSNVGLCVSERTVERLKEFISNDAIQLANDLISSGQLYYIAFDNINIYLRKFQQRLTNANSMIHATNAAVIAIDADDIDKEKAINLEEYLKLRGGRSKAKLADILPDDNDEEKMLQAFQGHIGLLIVRYCPGADKWNKDRRKEMMEEMRKLIPEERPLPVQKTRAFPWGVFDVNEGSKKGLVRVLEKMRTRSTLSITDWVAKVRIFLGDWLTSANFRGARRDRSDDVTPMERLEYGFPLSTLWHYALQATHMIMRTHYGHNPTADPTCLQAHKDWLRRTWDASKPNYAASKSLIRHSLIARLLYIVMIRVKKRTYKTLGLWRPTLDELKMLVKDIVENFATTNAADKAKQRQDDWAAHDAYFIRDALLFCEFEDAVAHADAGRILRIMKFWCLGFRGAGQHNYARECAEVLIQWKYETTAELRKVLERSWFVNRWGLAGRWIASDLYIEQLNFWIKRVLIAHGNGVTIEYIQKRGSACVEAFREVMHMVANFFGDSDRARRSKEVAFHTDLEALVNELFGKKIHVEPKEPRIVWAPAPKVKLDADGKPILSKTAPTKKSAIVDGQDLGAGVWQAGKFSEFIVQTTYDPALRSYPMPKEAGSTHKTTSDSTENDLLPPTYTALDDITELDHTSHGDLHGDDYDSGLGSLGGGGEFWTGNVNEIED